MKLLILFLFGFCSVLGQTVKTVNGLAIASVKTVDQLAIASVKTIDGLATTGGGSAPTVVSANVANGYSITDTNTFTMAVDCTGANYLIVDVLGQATGAFTGTFFTATYNGSSMTALLTNDVAVDGTIVYKRFRILSPTTGSNNLVITSTGSNYGAIYVGAIPMTGVNVTTPEGTSATNFAVDTAPTATVSSATNELVIAYVFASAAITGNGASQTQIYTHTPSGDTQRATSKAGAASVVSSFTLSGAAPWVMGSTPVKP